MSTVKEKLLNTQIVQFSRTIALTFLAIASILVIAAPISFAQSFRGSIRGVITDAHSLAIPGSKITARNLGTSETREVSSDSQGIYFFPELPTGDYEIAAFAAGFQEVRAPHVIVNVGEATVVDLKLAKPTEKVEHVIVSDNVPLVETASATLSQVVDRRLVQELPLNGRDFGKLVALTPGVTVEGSGVAGSEKGAGQFNINGNRDRSNNYALDGTDNNDPFFNNSALNQVGIAGAPATLLPLDAIQEFNLQSQFGAEYGRNTGSVVNIITRSGTNNFHGSLYEYNRNTVFDARNYFNTSPNPQSHLNNNNFGGSLGGPVIKDRTFFFAAYEGQRERVGSDFNFQVPTPQDVATARLDAGIAPATPPTPADKILAFFPVSASRTLPSTVHDSSDDDNFIVKADHKLNTRNTLTGRYAFGQGDQQFPFGSLGGFGSGSRLAAFANESPTRVQVISTSLLTAFSPSKLNELRFGYSRFRTNFRSIDDTFNPSVSLGLNFGTGKPGLPEFDFNGAIENLGASGFSLPRGRISETFQTLDNFTWIRGRHTLKFGGEYHRYDVQGFNDNLERGILDVNTTTITGDPVIDNLIGFYHGNFSTSADTGNTHRFTFNNGLSYFAQDDVRIRPNFTLNVGLRWEYFGPLGEENNLLSNFDASGHLVLVGSSTLPHLYNRDLNNFGPRIGFAWKALRSTVIRAGYGLYYDYLPQNNLIANVTTSAGVATNPVLSLTGTPNFVGGMDYNPPAFTNPATATAPIFIPTASTQSIFITDRNLRTPYVGNWNLNIQQQLGGSAAFEIGYIGSKGTKLSRLYDANQARTNTAFSAIDVFSDGANSTYHALQTTVRLQAWHRLSGFSTYTWSKSLDGASDGINFNFANAAFPEDSTNLPAEKGPSTFDTRHRWTSALNYQAPVIPHMPKLLADGWQLNTILTVQSGRPINIVTSNCGVNCNFVQRPDVVPGQRFILPNWTPTTGYLNPLAFANPAITVQDPNGFFGNLGRDRVYGPGFWNADFSLSKIFAVREKLSLQFRAEFFNIFNHPDFALPTNVVSIGAPNAGLITQTPDVAQGNPGLGGGGPRVMQFGLRLQF